MRRAFVLSWSIQLLLAAGVHAANLPSGTTAPPTDPGIGLGSNSPYTATTAGQFAAACKIDQASCAAMIGNVLMDKSSFRQLRISASLTLPMVMRLAPG